MKTKYFGQRDSGCTLLTTSNGKQFGVINYQHCAYVAGHGFVPTYQPAISYRLIPAFKSPVLQ